MNKKFVIVSDSCCEMNEDMRKQYDVDYRYESLFADGLSYQ